MLNFEFRGDFRMIFGSVRPLDSLSRQLRLPSSFVGVFDHALRLGTLELPSRSRCDRPARRVDPWRTSHRSGFPPEGV